jgi:hypothetical protein
VKSAERNYICRMEYLNLFFKKASSKSWELGAIVTAVLGLAATLVWGDREPMQDDALLTVASFIVVMVVRLLLVVPYQLWAEERAKLVDLEKLEADPLRVQRKLLLKASSHLFTSSKEIYNEWKSSDQRKRDLLLEGFSSKRACMNILADRFLHEDDIYKAAQNAMQHCYIMMDDAKADSPDHKALQDAHKYTKRLLVLLTPDNDKKP